ncbi:STAS domain-containing protein [Actinomadura adrarensis]|uniref:STAS domain-containing protein n=1 Tax=Actinomadura adrarensis TaxID=1819600 RepID=A0ABW3CRD5_9ACTN
MIEQAIDRTLDPAGSDGDRAERGRDVGYAIEGVRVRTALLQLDGVFEPPYLVVAGEIDLATVAVFTAALSSMVERGTGDVWVDVEKLGFIDVGGLRALASAACRLELQERRLVLRSVAPHLVKLMDLVGWSRIPGLLMIGRHQNGTARAVAL